MAQAYGSGEAPELIQQLPGQAPAGLQATSPEPAYKKTKLAHLRVKVPGGVNILHPSHHFYSHCCFLTCVLLQWQLLAGGPALCHHTFSANMFLQSSGFQRSCASTSQTSHTQLMHSATHSALKPVAKCVSMLAAQTDHLSLAICSFCSLLQSCCTERLVL